MTSAAHAVCTLGHSNHAIERFIELLAANGVEVVADVRSQPYSRFCPQYRRDNLRAHLQAAGIAYEFLGRELGARSDDDACYVDDRVDYARLAATPLFGAGIERVEALAAVRRVALVCAERDPLECHRTILVVRALATRGCDAQHIHADGRLETHTDAVARLVREELASAANADLFREHAGAGDDAFARRASKIAYVRKHAATARRFDRRG
jgi:uncharacterized protein (DUF488 family)